MEIPTGRDMCGLWRASWRVASFACARVFAVAKSGKADKQRKIWDGSSLSKQASQPPKPMRLANPASFLDIVVRPGETLYMSKRDASTYFDALSAPRHLHEWFAQEPVYVWELLSDWACLP